MVIVVSGVRCCPDGVALPNSASGLCDARQDSRSRTATSDHNKVYRWGQGYAKHLRANRFQIKSPPYLNGTLMNGFAPRLGFK